MLVCAGVVFPRSIARLHPEVEESVWCVRVCVPVSAFSVLVFSERVTVLPLKS